MNAQSLEAVSAITLHKGRCIEHQTTAVNFSNLQNNLRLDLDQFLS